MTQKEIGQFLQINKGTVSREITAAERILKQEWAKIAKKANRDDETFQECTKRLGGLSWPALLDLLIEALKESQGGDDKHE